MAQITAEAVKELREKTGAGMMDCKKALAETQGDMDKAIEHLRKAGIASASKKASRLASEGLVAIQSDGKNAAIVEVNCETDFVAKTEDFQNFVSGIAAHVLANRPKDVEELLTQRFQNTDKPLDLVTKELVGKIGENVSIRRFTVLSAQSGEQFGQYIHMGSKIGVIVKAKGDAGKLGDALKEIAMHVAAISPRYVRSAQIPQAEKDKEKEIYLAQMKDSGKPPEILEKILLGKIAKYGSEISLEEQVFVKDPSGKKTVAQFLKEKDPAAETVEFVRFQVGEGMAKKEEDFAAEVAKQLGK